MPSTTPEKPQKQPAARKPAEKASAPPLKPKAPAVDLLEPKKKPKKATTGDPATKAKSALPPISKLIPEAQPAAPPQPPPVPAPTPANQEAPAPCEPTPAAKAEPPSEPPAPPPKVLHLKTGLSIKDLAPMLGLKPFQIIKDLMDMGIFANANQVLDLDTIGKICQLHGWTLEREKKDPSKGHRKPEVKAEPPKPAEPAPQAALITRPPIVTFMGHVDHGKTSLLDAIRKTRVAAGEAGGITQHIGASSVERNGQRITFLDTPGHAAFTAMRARGANVTDIVVLVVAADDGLMPQSLEAINHARAAQVTIMVAINKIDVPGANPDKVKKQLQEQGLTPEEWGGQTICCEVSAIKGTGVDHLLDMILLQAEILELKADPKAQARGTVIETQLEQGRGPTATIIVRSGTLRVGDPFLCGDHWGKVKQLINDLGQPVKSAGPGMPIKVVGLSGLPAAGDELVVMESEREARRVSEERLEAIRTSKLATPRRATLENLFAEIAEGQKPCLRVVLKGDVSGSVEAITGALKDIPQNKVTLEIIHSAVGPVTESDVLLATASNAVIIGFGVKVENTAASAAKREGVQIKLFSIIYELIDQVREAMAGLLEPELRETVLGHAKVLKIFDLARGKVAGCYVEDGRIVRTARARVLRKKQPIYDGGIATLRRFKDEVKEVRAGLECGIRLGDFEEYLPEDIIQCYQLEKVPQQL